MKKEENPSGAVPLLSAMRWEEFSPDEAGLLPVVVQEDETGEVLMLAYFNEASYAATLESGRMTYYSRSRKTLWTKGETSGHYQYVRSLRVDCDRDTILARVTQIGAACHTGHHSCFYTDLTGETDEA